MQIRLILQARLNSSRLPGKVLLPVGGLPLVVLCARRAMTCGYPLVAVTSDQASDDPLVSVLDEHGIAYERGDLDDVLSRFVMASRDMDDSDLVVRLTGDNPCVDGDFIQDLLTFHVAHGHPYTRTLSPDDGLPYGLSAEIITAGGLRAIAAANPTAAHKEHVTLAWTESGDYQLFKNGTGADLSHLRVTVDTPEDYQLACRIFEGDAAQSIATPWQTLITRAAL